MEPILEMLYLYGFPAIATILAVVLGIIWVVMPPTAKLLLMKKLGIAKGGKGYIMVGDADRYLQTEICDVHAEGAMQVKKKKKRLTFYLAKPLPYTPNEQANYINEQRERDILPPYFLDGLLPVFMAIKGKAIATNPTLLAAWHIIKQTKTREYKTDAMLPATTLDEKTGEMVNTMPVEVLLPFDPNDIESHTPEYWKQVDTTSTELRHERIGEENARKEYKEYIWPLVIVGIVVIAGMVITGLAMHLF
jgi:hypothetical protein